MLKNIIEALIFASGSGIKKELIMEYMPETKEKDIDFAIDELKVQYSGDCGILLVHSSGKYIFQTNPAYGEILADVLTKEKERELSKTLLEVMAIIAYKQPITRVEIEDIRGVNSEYAIAMLLKLNLIDCIGRKETIGRPILYGSTEEFLLRFKLESINDLPDYDTLYEQIKSSYSALLFPEKVIEDVSEEEQLELQQKEAVATIDEDEEEIDEEISEEEYPDFLENEEFEIIE